MKVHFIRHNINFEGEDLKTAKVLEEIWSRGMAVIDYAPFPGEQAFDPKNYTGAAKTTLIRFKKLMSEGGYVGVVCHGVYPGKMLLGKISPTMDFQPTYFKSAPEYPFKAAQMDTKSLKVVTVGDCPGLFSKIPRQQTLCEWTSGENMFRAAYHGEPLESKVYSLSHGQLEVLCYEYMREQGLLADLLMPIGRSLESVDVVGLDKKGKVILAQVTFHKHDSGPQSKSASLRSAAPNFGGSERLMFCDSPSLPIDSEGNRVVSISEVFDHMWKKKPVLIRTMLGHK